MDTRREPMSRPRGEGSLGPRKLATYILNIYHYDPTIRTFLPTLGYVRAQRFGLPSAGGVKLVAMIDTRERPESGYREATVEAGDHEAAVAQLQGSLGDGEQLLSIRLP